MQLWALAKLFTTSATFVGIHIHGLTDHTHVLRSHWRQLVLHFSLP